LSKTNTLSPLVFAAYNADENVRKASTSGGLFSALANEMYDRGGYVGGAIFTETFGARHIISNNRDDLLKIRGSKYFQSDATGLYGRTKKLLLQGEKVLICGCPCQMAAAKRLFEKIDKNLILVDFVCCSINSPKVFRKYLDGLETEYNSKVISYHPKNKDMGGWHNFSFKAVFENGAIYQKQRTDDDFTRAFIEAHYVARPSCYECKFKTIPRISDITIADFWGIENVDKSMDSPLGTSLVLLNSEKGRMYYRSLDNTVVSKEKSLAEAMYANPAITKSLSKPAHREHFYADIDKYSFIEVSNKYFPKKNNAMRKSKSMVKLLLKTVRFMSFSPIMFIKFVHMNFVRKNTVRLNGIKSLIVPAKHTVLDIHKTAKIKINGYITLGMAKVRGSKLETRIRLESNTELNIENSFYLFSGADIQVFNGGKLTIGGNGGANINVQIVCGKEITIGEGTLIGRNVVIRDYDAHSILKENYKISAPIVIGKNVWIGQGAMINKGVTIGDGAVIASGSWVGSDVPPKCLVMGYPARVIEKNIEWRA
jgi:acetyltransferase-like isoleucine patch superfamily enzyme/coenzyme F420-reducing hydrogenase beta subunit